MQLKLIKKENISEDIFLFTFAMPSPLGWRAGQHMAFHLPHLNPDALGSKRTFSILSTPQEGEIKVLTHCGSPSTSFKRALRLLKPGSFIEASRPKGKFVMHDPSKEHIFVAGGVGIAAIRCMLADLDQRNIPIKATLFYNHTSSLFPLKQELEVLERRHPRFHIHYFVDPHLTEYGRIKERVSALRDYPIYMSGLYIQRIITLFNYHKVTK